MMANSSGDHASHGAHMAHSGMDHGNMNHNVVDHSSMDHSFNHGSAQNVEASTSDVCSNVGMHGHGMSVRICRDRRQFGATDRQILLVST